MPKIKEIREIKSKIKEVKTTDGKESESKEGDENEDISNEVLDMPLEIDSSSGAMETLTLEPVPVRRENRAEAVEIQNPNQRRENNVDEESMAGRVYARNTLREEEEGRLYGLRSGSQEEITRTYNLTTSAEPVTATLEESDDLRSNLKRQSRLGATELDQVRRGERIAREESQRYELQKKAKEESKPRRIHPWER